jgi:hypothetical protein
MSRSSDSFIAPNNPEGQVLKRIVKALKKAVAPKGHERIGLTRNHLLTGFERAWEDLSNMLANQAKAISGMTEAPFILYKVKELRKIGVHHLRDRRLRD